MAENIIVPLDKRGRRDWASLSDDAFVQSAQKFISEKKIKNRYGLQNADLGMYDALRRRHLLDRLEFKEGNRDWASMSDDEFVQSAQKFIEEKGITHPTGKGGLQTADRRMYDALYRRHLLDRLEFKERKRDLASMSDDALVQSAQKFIEENKIKSRKGLENADSGMYCTLRKRNLLDRLEFPIDERAWHRYSDDTLVQSAQKSIEEKGITHPAGKGGLENADSGMYGALRRRHLLGRLEFKERKRDWASMSDDEFVQSAQKFIEENKIKSRKGLENADPGMYKALCERHLRGRLEFKENRRDWASMSNDAFVQSAQKSIQESGIKSKGELATADPSMYQALRTRHLLDRVFAPIEQAQELARKAELDRQLKEGVNLYLGRTDENPKKA